MPVPLINLAPNLKVSRLCLGAMTFGEQNSLLQFFRLLDETFNAGIVAGPSIHMTWIRGGPKCLDGRNITEAIDSSLKRMQVDYIDLYQIHWPDRYVPVFGETENDPTDQFCSVGIEEQLDGLGRAVTAGTIRYIGVSNETPYGVTKFSQVAERVAHYPKIVSLQVVSFVPVQ